MQRIKAVKLLLKQHRSREHRSLQFTDVRIKVKMSAPRIGIKESPTFLWVWQTAQLMRLMLQNLEPNTTSSPSVLVDCRNAFSHCAALLLTFARLHGGKTCGACLGIRNRSFLILTENGHRDLQKTMSQPSVNPPTPTDVLRFLSRFCQGELNMTERSVAQK